MVVKKRGLGRGLDALLTASQPDDAAPAKMPESELQKLAIEFLQPGKYQPRKDMSQQALEDLALSIRAQGVIQPIVVRKVASDKYEIIAGERRWRAAQLAQLDQVPCIIRDVPDEAAVAIALIENIQREDLNAMEEAVALERLLTEFELTHQQVADAVGKSRTSITNLLRLNLLNDDVKVLLEHGDIDMGHARALLALDDELQSEAARQVAAKQLTVRETESLVRRLQQPPVEKQNSRKDPDVVSLEQRLSEHLAAPVQIDYNRKGKGKMVIAYSSLDELEQILSKIQLEALTD
ncbi:ParB/RepB/Spo0J family partition protein [Alkalimonas collagenimarina]|uniref:Probable chromosome-partitioning protein ParB n=1 Tax=Alkalimonas collagenimarina TaxID=400390 RepID=A0ABT9H1E6_9GAMM|nr:ParB/RepB/Spo0J family partition protein [Alkalimonas collagenimarina]MDP4537142.1 ParB/RepB/Spo0J family partition protein [Alkalimonas collagenimarina]